MGLSRMFSGRGGDGLVLIKNASVWGRDEEGNVSAPCATAYVYRSHSGFFGIVNSEEGYQNLTRFLFGDIRVDIWVDIEKTNVPEHVEKAWKNDKKIEALHLFSVEVAPRGALWNLTRRVVLEDSVACAGFEEMYHATKQAPHRVYLTSVFLNSGLSLDPNRRNVVYGLKFGIRVPDYVIDNALWLDTHVEGRDLYAGELTFELPTTKALLEGNAADDGCVKYRWGGGKTKSVPCDAFRAGEPMEIPVSFNNAATPGVAGNLRFVVSHWD
jgi:hypothetical protein